MQVKTCPATIKAAGTQDGTDEGVFEAIVATYDLDSVGDQIVPGAFASTLAEWKDAGNPIPVLWSHMSADPDYHIGVVEEAEERPEGLWVKARLDLDEPKSAKVYKLLKGRRITQFSFAYDVLEGGPAGEKDDGTVEEGAPEGVFELRKLKLYEVGPCLIGANQATNLLDVKHVPPTAETVAKIADTAAELKAGRTLSKQNEDRVAAIARLAQELLESVKTEQEQESTPSSNAEKATPTPPADAPAAAVEVAAKSDEPAPVGTASMRLRTVLDLLEVEGATYTI